MNVRESGESGVLVRDSARIRRIWPRVIDPNSGDHPFSAGINFVDHARQSRGGRAGHRQSSATSRNARHRRQRPEPIKPSVSAEDRGRRPKALSVGPLIGICGASMRCLAGLRLFAQAAHGAISTGTIGHRSAKESSRGTVILLNRANNSAIAPELTIFSRVLRPHRGRAEGSDRMGSRLKLCDQARIRDSLVGFRKRNKPRLDGAMSAELRDTRTSAETCAPIRTIITRMRCIEPFTSLTSPLWNMHYPFETGSGSTVL